MNKKEVRRVKIAPWNEDFRIMSQCTCCGLLRKYYGGIHKTPDGKRRCCDEAERREQDYINRMARDGESAYHHYMSREAAKYDIPYRDPDGCSHCGDGGCVYCEPKRFL